MNQSEFDQLPGATPALSEIYRVLPKPTAPGESPIDGIFGPDRGQTSQPVFTPPASPIGFESIFGAFPEGEPKQSPARSIWDSRLKRFGGLYDLTQIPNFEAKNAAARAAGLGNVIGYVYDGAVLVTFEALRGSGWSQDLSQYMAEFTNMVNVALLEAAK